MGWEIFFTRVFQRFNILSFAIDAITSPLPPQGEIWEEFSQFFTTNPRRVIALFVNWGIFIKWNNMLHNGKQEDPERKDFLIHKIENDILAKSSVLPISCIGLGKTVAAHWWRREMSRPMAEGLQMVPSNYECKSLIIRNLEVSILPHRQRNDTLIVRQFQDDVH